MRARFAVLMMFLLCSIAEASPEVSEDLRARIRYNALNRSFEAYSPSSSLWWPVGTGSMLPSTSESSAVWYPYVIDPWRNASSTSVHDDAEFLWKAHRADDEAIHSLTVRTNALERLLYGLIVILLGSVFYSTFSHRRIDSVRRDLEALNRQMNPPEPPQDGPMRSSGESEMYCDGAAGVYSRSETTARIKKMSWYSAIVFCLSTTLLIALLVGCFGAFCYALWRIFQ